MFSISSWLHLRIPFSYFLLPVFLFSLTISPNVTAEGVLWTFIIIHIFLYPASNGYNSYFDKDEKSIGGLKNPPPVKRGLYYLSLSFDAIAILLGYFAIHLTFAIMLLIYGLVSKAYSHPGIRLKKYSIIGWFVAGLFQGFFTFVMCYVGINSYALENSLSMSVGVPGLLCSGMLWANYPMTQIYQHEEDGKRGDKTLSRMLGIRGTFYFVAVVFALVTLGFVLYLNKNYSAKYSFTYVTAMGPVIIYFIYWFIKVYKNATKADFKHTMWLNFLSATCLNGFFIYLFLYARNYIQLFD
ncbi:MAG: UbiA family prenyltransferase [Cyclobacteriaceae bacterium]|nr:UbiA family prenyltransferase [Cyclobacteriaceae bacterium]MDH5249511.1 UbiA family prenyltransferase [Cyclobacteriaceae bacterium]